MPFSIGYFFLTGLNKFSKGSARQVIHACGGPHLLSVRHDIALLEPTRCAMTPAMTCRDVGDLAF
jgi:hypothetical protein